MGFQNRTYQPTRLIILTNKHWFLSAFGGRKCPNAATGISNRPKWTEIHATSWSCLGFVLLQNWKFTECKVVFFPNIFFHLQGSLTSPFVYQWYERTALARWLEHSPINSSPGVGSWMAEEFQTWNNTSPRPDSSQHTIRALWTFEQMLTSRWKGRIILMHLNPQYRCPVTQNCQNFGDQSAIQVAWGAFINRNPIWIMEKL